MAFQIGVWQVENSTLSALPARKLDSEERLEDWIAADTSILGLNIVVIGRQVVTPFRGRVDLLCIDEEGRTVILELKRDRTPRDVVAQVLDYGSWVQTLGFDDLDSICTGYRSKGLEATFSEVFDSPLPEEINTQHRLYVVASLLDDSSERIVSYLADYHGIDINAVFFTCFDGPAGEIVARAWLRDPEQTSEHSQSRKQSPWTGFWFVNVGEGPHRNWDDNQKYGYISAGQGLRYSAPLKKLSPGSKVFAYMKGRGYVGYGDTTAEAMPIRDYMPATEQKPLLALPLVAPQASDNSQDMELCEWVIPVRWRTVFGRDDAKSFTGVFANQNIVCKLRHAETLEYLRNQFSVATNADRS